MSHATIAQDLQIEVILTLLRIWKRSLKNAAIGQLFSGELISWVEYHTN